MKKNSFKQKNIRFEFEGRMQCLNEWAKEKNIDTGTLYSRWRKGLRGNELFTRVYSKKEWGQIVGERKLGTGT